MCVYLSVCLSVLKFSGVALRTTDLVFFSLWSFLAMRRLAFEVVLRCGANWLLKSLAYSLSSQTGTSLKVTGWLAGGFCCSVRFFTMLHSRGLLFWAQPHPEIPPTCSASRRWPPCQCPSSVSRYRDHPVRWPEGIPVPRQGLPPLSGSMARFHVYSLLRYS